jgi:hypothetical protein
VVPILAGEMDASALMPIFNNLYLENLEMTYAAIDTLNDVVLGVGSMAACEEYVRVACVEARNNGQPYSEEDTPSVSDFADMDKYYQDLLAWMVG